MLTYDNKQIRNLVEQVQYLSDLHETNKALASWGIKVVGQIETSLDLPDPTTYEGDFGDAYAVGTEAPFSFYIWTRSTQVGQPAYWFPFGEISIVGPQGPEGPQGETGVRGERGTRTTIGQNPPPSNLDGDLFISTSTNNGRIIGAVYQYSSATNTWSLVYDNFRGPQGIQGVQGIQGPVGPQGPDGPKGDTGDVGGFINIGGIVTNTSQLPDPTTLGNRTIAYLIGSGVPYDLYVQVGDTPESLQWLNTGPLNVSTLVSVDGNYVNLWDADTKVDVDAEEQSGAFVRSLYARRSDGTVIRTLVAQTPRERLVPCYNDRRTLQTDTPTEAQDCVNLNYLQFTYGITVQNQILSELNAALSQYQAPPVPKYQWQLENSDSTKIIWISKEIQSHWLLTTPETFEPLNGMIFSAVLQDKSVTDDLPNGIRGIREGAIKINYNNGVSSFDFFYFNNDGIDTKISATVDYDENSWYSMLNNISF